MSRYPSSLPSLFPFPFFFPLPFSFSSSSLYPFFLFPLLSFLTPPSSPPSSFANSQQATYGGLDILVNNAGFAFHGDAWGEEVARTTVNTNYYGTKRVCEAFLPLMREGGRVVNISSTAGIERGRREKEGEGKRREREGKRREREGKEKGKRREREEKEKGKVGKGREEKEKGREGKREGEGESLTHPRLDVQAQGGSNPPKIFG
jgi:hypothetical protein